MYQTVCIYYIVYTKYIIYTCYCKLICFSFSLQRSLSIRVCKIKAAERKHQLSEAQLSTMMMEFRKPPLIWLFLILTMAWLTRPAFAQQMTGSSNDTMSYNIVEKLPPGVFVASIVNDAKLAQTLDQSIINSLQFEVLKGAFKEYFTIESPNGLLKTRKIIDRDLLCSKQVFCSLPLDVAIIRPAQRFQIFKLEVTVIDVNDNNPRFEPSTLTLSVSESALPGTVLVLPSAQDLDSGSFDIQNYSFTSNSSKFELQITQNLDGTSDLRLLLKEKLDRELEDKYTATISATDGGSPPKTGNLEVTVMVQDANDNSPVFDKALYNISIREDFPVNGVLVWVRATDADEGSNSEVVYSFARQTQVAFGPMFSIDSTRGDISLRQALDFERESVYALLVVASDRGPDSVPVYAKVIISVEDLNDNAPVIRMNAVDSNGFAEVGETEPILSFVAHISAEDADSGPNGEVNCELLQGSGFGLQMLYAKEFKLVTTTVFDREQADQYSVTILCHDNGMPPLSTSKDLVIRITDTNDNAPEFDQKDYSATIREGNTQGVPILRVNATDADSGPNAVVEYKLCPDAKGLVSIGNATGLMTANVVFDYEKIKEFQFCIVASDRGSPRLSTTAIVTLTIVDVNDEAPVFGQPSYTFGTYENQPPNSEIGTVSAIDADSKPYDKFVFSILKETPETNSFSIDPWTGRITTTVILDRETCVAHYLTIAATDVTFPNPSSIANVTIYVADKNDNAPHVEYPTRENNTVEVSSFSPVGFAFTRVFATDVDSGNNAKLNYAILKGNKDNIFDIDPISGTVSVNKDLKELRESERKPIRLIISVSDSGTPPKSSEVTLNVIISTSPALANLVQQTTSDLEFTSHKKILIIVGGITAVLVSILITSIVCIKWRQAVYNRKFRRYWPGTDATPAQQRTEESRYLNISECYTAIKEGQQSKNASPAHKSPQLANHNRKNVHFDLSLDPSDIAPPTDDLSTEILKSKVGLCTKNILCCR